MNHLSSVWYANIKLSPPDHEATLLTDYIHILLNFDYVRVKNMERKHPNEVNPTSVRG